MAVSGWRSFKYSRHKIADNYIRIIFDFLKTSPKYILVQQMLYTIYMHLYECVGDNNIVPADRMLYVDLPILPNWGDLAVCARLCALICGLALLHSYGQILTKFSLVG